MQACVLELSHSRTGDKPSVAEYQPAGTPLDHLMLSVIHSLHQNWVQVGNAAASISLQQHISLTRSCSTETSSDIQPDVFLMVILVAAAVNAFFLRIIGVIAGDASQTDHVCPLVL